MNTREQAIEAAASAIHVRYCGDNCTEPHSDWQTADADVVLAAAVPVLLNDLADRIEAERLTDDTGDPEDNGYNCAISDVLGIVRAAAEGWGQ